MTEKGGNAIIAVFAGVMELADVTDSKSVGLIIRVGSSPTTGTIDAACYAAFFFLELRGWASDTAAL